MSKKRTCSEHGLVRRKGAKHCPACGEELLVISVFPFKVYFSRTAALFFAFPLFLLGTFIVFDTPGCISGCIQRSVIRNKAVFAEKASRLASRQANEEQLMKSFPPFWRDEYHALTGLNPNNYQRWMAVQARFKETPDHSLPKMTGEQVAKFISMFSYYKLGEVYALVYRLMKEEPEDDF